MMKQTNKNHSSPTKNKLKCYNEAPRFPNYLKNYL